MRGILLVFLLCVGELFAEKLIVGTTSGYAPYVSLNTAGEYEGFDIDFSKELSNKLGRTLEIKDLGGMAALMMALNQGKVDVVIWAVSITEKRKEKIEMIHYQGKTIDKMPFLFWKTIPNGVLAIEDLAKEPHPVIACVAGSSQEELLRQFPDLKVKTLDKITDVVFDLKYGKSFGAPIDPPLLPIYLKKFPELKVVSLKIPKSQYDFGMGVCITKSNTALISEIRHAVDELKKEGIIASLEKKWKIE